jgi:hypothetical protein
MATTEERIDLVQAALDKVLARGLASESYNGHAQGFIAPTELIRAEDHLRTLRARETAAAGSTGLGTRRLLARFDR